MTRSNPPDKLDWSYSPFCIPHAVDCLLKTEIGQNLHDEQDSDKGTYDQRALTQWMKMSFFVNPSC